MTRLRTIINNQNNRLKLIALLAGYNIWIIYSSWLPTTVTLPLPLYVYNLPANTTLVAPEYITVTLQGTYNALRSLDEQTGLHIDGSKLPLGSTTIPVTHTMLLLPRTLSVLNYTPAVVAVTLQNSSTLA